MKPASEKPNLLMVSHCLPDPLGNAARARTWQLLRLVSGTHRVSIVCRLDGPVRLDQWQAVRRLTTQFAVQTPRASWWSRPWRGRGTDRALVAGIEQLASRVNPVVLLCTSPCLRKEAAAVAAPLRICDLDAPARAFQHEVPIRRRSQRQAHSIDEPTTGFLNALAADFDLLTLGHAGYLDAGDRDAPATLVLPGAVDLASFRVAQEPDEDRESPAPRLVFHSTWQQRSDHEIYAWFRRHVWPKVQQAVPQARISATQAVPDQQPLGTLREAAVVVSPEPDPGRARWPVLQALAAGRAVIVPQQAANDMGARHGEHLLAARRRGDWAELCIESLRSASMRTHLARGARAFLKDHCPMEKASREFHTRLGMSGAGGLPLAVAA